MTRCSAVTSLNRKCKLNASGNNEFCHIHQGVREEEEEKYGYDTQRFCGCRSIYRSTKSGFWTSFKTIQCVDCATSSFSKNELGGKPIIWIGF